MRKLSDLVFRREDSGSSPCDMVVEVESHKWKLDRAVVSHLSTFFKDACRDSWNTNSHKKPLHVTFPEQDADYLPAILEFIYAGGYYWTWCKIESSSEVLELDLGLVIMAHKYGVNDLAECALRTLGEDLLWANIPDMLNFLARAFGDDDGYSFVKHLGEKGLCIQEEARKTIMEALVKKGMKQPIHIKELLKLLTRYPVLAGEIMKFQNTVDEEYEYEEDEQIDEDREFDEEELDEDEKVNENVAIDEDKESDEDEDVNENEATDEDEELGENEELDENEASEETVESP